MRASPAHSYGSHGVLRDPLDVVERNGRLRIRRARDEPFEPWRPELPAVGPARDAGTSPSGRPRVRRDVWTIVHTFRAGRLVPTRIGYFHPLITTRDGWIGWYPCASGDDDRSEASGVYFGLPLDAAGSFAGRASDSERGVGDFTARGRLARGVLRVSYRLRETGELECDSGPQTMSASLTAPSGRAARGSLPLTGGRAPWLAVAGGLALLATGAALRRRMREL